MNVVASRDADVTKPRRAWRGKLFLGFAGLFTLLGWLMLDGVIEGLSPWWLIPDYDPHPELHRWHYAEHGARIAILLSGSLLALLWRPQDKPVLLQFYAIGWTAMLIGYAALVPSDELVESLAFGAVIYLVVGLLAVTYPDRRALFEFRREGPVSRPIMGITLAMAAILLPLVVTRAHYQLTVSGEHADMGGGSSGVALNLMLIAGGLLVASKRPGWRTLGVIVGLALIYLSAAAVTIPDHKDSWGLPGALLALIAGVAFIALTLREDRQTVASVEPVSAGAD